MFLERGSICTHEAVKVKLVDVRLSKKRDTAAAKAFFEKALSMTGEAPERVTTNGYDAYPRAVKETLGEIAQHRTSRYLNDRPEQDHRGIKGRYKEMRGFNNFASVQRFCNAFDGLREYLRPLIRPYEVFSLSERRSRYLTRTQSLVAAVGGV